MSTTYLAARGCVFVVPAQGQGNAGLYSIDGFPQASPTAPVLLQGVEMTDNDILMPVATLNDFKILYTFGQDFGNVTIYGELLLGPGGSLAAALTNLLEWFQANRTSASLAPVSLSLPGGTAYKIYIAGLSLGRADIELCTQSFAITAIKAEPPTPAS